MLLTSPAFFAFLAVVFFVYWAAAGRRFPRLAVLLFANLFFYARWHLAYLAIVPAAATIDFWIGSALARTGRQPLRRLLVTISIAVNVGLIASLRYAPNFDSWHWVLPLGLSFYAFQSMTYTIDIYRRDADPTSSYLAYLCSASFFPTALAGPITRLPGLVAQFEAAARIPDAAASGRALFLIGLGLAKKFLIADYLAENLINRVFDTPRLYSAAETIIALYGYALQLYYDFSGYTDIAVGAALLAGIQLPRNFNRPYLATDLADFWRRWHITLSTWLRDYVYFSLPGLRSKRSILPYANLVITMTIGGIWHGASVTFAVWGLLHGLGLAAVRGWSVAKRRAAVPDSTPVRILKTLATFHFVAFAWIFFRSPNFETAHDILAQIGSHSAVLSNVSTAFWFVLLIAAAAQLAPARWYESLLGTFTAAPAYVQAAALVLLIMGIQYVTATGAAPFIYTKF